MRYSVGVLLINLAVLILGQFLVKYTLFESFKVPVALDLFDIILLAVSTLCIGIAGYVNTRAFSGKVSRIQLPPGDSDTGKINPKTANKLFFALNIMGVLIGFYLANKTGHPAFSILFIMASALLYAYTNVSRKYLLLGPLILSFLVGLSLLSVGIFDLIPAITSESKTTSKIFFSILADYALMLFALNFVRELIVKQMNMEKDHKDGIKSISVSLGRERTNTLIFGLTFLPLAGAVYYILNYLYRHNLSLVYALVFVMIPLVFVLLKILSAKNARDYARLEVAVRIVMFFTIISIGLYQFILK